MAESREQFRQRLNKQYWATYYDTMHKTGHLGSTRAEEHAAEAVYATALRDAIKVVRAQETPAAWGTRNFYAGSIEDHAASLGIDLDDAP